MKNRTIDKMMFWLVLLTGFFLVSQNALQAAEAGTLMGIGDNYYYQLGDGTNNDAKWPKEIEPGVIAAAVYYHSLYVKEDGTLMGVGYNGNGQLGDGTTADKSTPVQIDTGVSAVAVGAAHSLYLKSDGTLMAMGYNANGQLGDGTTTRRTTPVQIATGVTAVAAGQNHSLYLKSDGTLMAMGRNDYGQLGDGTTANRSTPVQIDTGVSAISGGNSHSLYLKSDGTFMTVGYNRNGELGDGTTTDRSTPMEIATGVSAIAAGGTHSLYVKNDGTLMGTGYSGNGQLGITVSTYTPIEIATGVSAVAAGIYHSLYVKNDGTLMGMGYNTEGQLGDGTTTVSRSTPLPIATEVLWVVGGYMSSFYARDPAAPAEPFLMGMGNNTNGRLGDGTAVSKSIPTKIVKDPLAVSAGSNHSLYLENDGTLMGMGENGYGELGDGTTTDRVIPVQIDTGVSAVSAGFLHSLYLKSDGTLMAMGRNTYGQLGDGTTTNKTTPVQIDTGVSAVLAGKDDSFYLKDDGTLMTMGRNIIGLSGGGLKTIPVQVATGVIAFAYGERHLFYVESDGTLMAMGLNTSGQLGDGTTTNRYTPVQIDTGVSAVSAVGNHSLYLKSDGTLMAMGGNGHGQLGDGTTTERHTPVQIDTNVTKIEAGYLHSLYLKSDGTLMGMGWNNSGQLGDGTTTDRYTPIQIATGVKTMDAGYTHNFYITGLTVSDPEILPAAGIYLDSVAVSLSTSTSDASLYYTVDGSEPDESATLYSAPFTLTTSAEVKAKGFKTGADSSAVISAAYEVYDSSTPKPVPTGGGTIPVSFTTDEAWTASATVGWITVAPTSGTGAEAIEQIEVTAEANTLAETRSGTVNVVADVGGAVLYSFTIEQAADSTASPAVAIFSPAAGIYLDSVEVTLSSSTSGASVYYTVDGSEPDGSATLYAAPFTLTASTEVKAIAMKSGFPSSAVTSAAYEVYSSSTPKPVPTGGETIPVSFTTDEAWTASATVDWITVSPTSGTGAEAIEQIEVTVEANTLAETRSGTVNVVADVGGAVLYSFTIEQAADPTASPAVAVFSPAAGVYLNSVEVTLSTSTSGASVYYTVDGSEPDGSATLYAAPFTLTDSTEVKAIAMKTGHPSSAVTSAAYEVYSSSTPKPTPTGGGTIPVSFTTDEAWTASATVGWITVSPTSGTGAEAIEQIEVTAQANTLAENRSGTVNVVADVGGAVLYSFTIEQAADSTASPAVAVFSPAAGVYLDSVEVTLSTSTSGALVYYTVDGSEPDGSATLYAAPFTLTASTEVKAIAMKSGFPSSAVTSAAYEVYSSSTPKPTPTGGGTIPVSFATDEAWTASATVGWITVSPTSGTGAEAIEQIEVTVEANTLAETRSGTVNVVADVGGALLYSFTIEQAADSTASPAVAVFSPAAGVYLDSVEVTLSTSTSGASVYYTVDGSEPDGSATLYAAPFTLTGSTEVKAIAMKSGFPSSAVTSAAYEVYSSSTPKPTPTGGGTIPVSFTTDEAWTASATVGWITVSPTSGTGAEAIEQIEVTVEANTLAESRSGTVNIIADVGGALLYSFTIEQAADSTASPAVAVFSPATGIYLDSVEVSLSTSTSGASVYYTVDGSEPDGSATLYAAPFTLTGSTEVKAIAMKSGFPSSAVTSAAYEVYSSSTPKPTPTGGGTIPVSFATDEAWTASATVDWITISPTSGTGAEAIEQIEVTAQANTLAESRSGTVNIVADVGGAVLYSFTIEQAADSTASPAVAVFSPAAGVYLDSVTVSLSTSTSGASVYYTVDGSEPDESATLYSVPLDLTDSTYIQAIAIKSGHPSSEVSTGFYEVYSATQPMSVPTNGANTPISFETDEAWTASTTVDWITVSPTSGTGAEAIEQIEMTVETNTLIESRSGTVNIIADADESVLYSFTVEQAADSTVAPATPLISPAGGAYLDSVRVTLSTSTSSASVYYTVDGSTPDESATLYATPFTLMASGQVKAVAIKSGHPSSAMVSAAYQVYSSDDPMNVSSDGGDSGLSLVVGETWTARTTADWITFTVGSGSGGLEQLQFEVSANTSSKGRSGIIEIVSATGEVLYTLRIEQAEAGAVNSMAVAMSARTAVGTNAKMLIAGMVFKGPDKTKVIVRGLGPDLEKYGVQGCLADPEIVIYSGQNVIATNDDWQQAPDDLAPYFSQVGVSDLADQAKDAALYMEFDPGAYTMHMKGVDNEKGVGLAEVYVVDPVIAGSGLLGLSARAEVGKGERVLIPGFVITGDESRRVLIRGVGPGLEASDVPGFLPDPQIKVYSGNTMIDENEDWEDRDGPALQAAFAEIGLQALAKGSKDAAVLLTLEPGIYTAHIGSSDGVLGIGLLEMYFLDPEK